MNPILGTIIFAIVLFVYIHIYHHLKVSNDLDVYEVDFPSKENFEEICDVRQPALFDMELGDLSKICSIASVANQYKAFDVCIRNVSERKADDQIYVPLALGAAIELVSAGKGNSVLSENNTDFLTETGLVHQMKHNDGFLRPPMVSSCKYDWQFAAAGTRTPFRYEIGYRNYLTVNEGSLKIKLAPPKSSKYLYGIKDFDNTEFRSPVDPWEPQPQYKADFSKIKCLEITLTPGKVFYIPAYWWYSVEFAPNTSLCFFSYSTYMSTLSTIHYHIMSLLQRSNTRNRFAKVLNDEQTKSVVETSTNESGDKGLEASSPPSQS